VTVTVATTTRGRFAGLLRAAVLDPVVRAATRLPLAVAAVPMALFGLAGTAARVQRGLAVRFSTMPARGASAAVRPGLAARPAPARGPAAVRVLAHSLLVALPALVAFVVVGLAGFTVYSGYLYPVRPDTSFAIGHPFSADPGLSGAWGGPTLVGAWFVHSCVALGIQVIGLALLRGLVRLQGRVTRWLL
jgi:hypothetical protein